METFLVHLDLVMPSVCLDQHNHRLAVLDASRSVEIGKDPDSLESQRDSLEQQVELVVPLELDSAVE